jgi:hypothetical protein
MVEAAAREIAHKRGITYAVWDLPTWLGDRVPYLYEARAALTAAFNTLSIQETVK